MQLKHPFHADEMNVSGFSFVLINVKMLKFREMCSTAKFTIYSSTNCILRGIRILIRSRLKINGELDINTEYDDSPVTIYIICTCF